MSRRIAEVALAYMAREGHETLCWGDGALCEIGHAAGIVLERPHPMNMIQRVADALARCPDLFETFHIHGCDTGGEAGGSGRSGRRGEGRRQVTPRTRKPDRGRRVREPTRWQSPTGDKSREGRDLDGRPTTDGASAKDRPGSPRSPGARSMPDPIPFAAHRATIASKSPAPTRREPESHREMDVWPRPVLPTVEPPRPRPTLSLVR